MTVHRFPGNHRDLPRFADLRDRDLAREVAQRRRAARLLSRVMTGLTVALLAVFVAGQAAKMMGWTP